MDGKKPVWNEAGVRRCHRTGQADTTLLEVVRQRTCKEADQTGKWYFAIDTSQQEHWCQGPLQDWILHQDELTCTSNTVSDVMVFSGVWHIWATYMRSKRRP